ncbi:uncharacterized protein [Rutidosis leptorrhynchoides]|uniref:uncharacterized protein n=1 Tax=Rutidosis leptorrhynchoides TaxID=125765 RepID=UPI003A99DD8A
MEEVMGKILLFVSSLFLDESGVLSSGGGYGNPNRSGGGRNHFHLSHIATGGVYQQVSSVKGNISIRCRSLLFTYTLLTQRECPLGTYKNITGSDMPLCFKFPPDEFPHRTFYVPVRDFIKLIVIDP